MKPRLIPLYFDPGRDAGFDDQLNALHNLLADRAELLTPVALGAPLPEAEAVVFPQLLGEGYRRLADFKALRLPILIVTSPYGTLSLYARSPTRLTARKDARAMLAPSICARF